MSNEKRNKLRAKALGQKPVFQKELIEGFEVRQPSLRDRSEIIKTVSDVEGKIDSEKFLTQCLINHIYVPDTDEKVFEIADIEAMISHPTGGLIDKLSQAAMRLFNIDIEAARKN